MLHLKETVTHSIEVKKSKFIAVLIPVVNEDETREALLTVRKQYPNATHYCRAMIIGNTQRSSDDGEPSGTAGLPMLECLRHKELDNVLAIVVRYFGGTLLGTGGLVRAYQQAVNEAIEKAALTTPVEMNRYQVTVPYSLNDKAERILNTMALITDRQYGEDVTIIYLCEKDLTVSFEAISQGKIRPLFLNKETVEYPL